MWLLLACAAPDGGLPGSDAAETGAPPDTDDDTDAGDDTAPDTDTDPGTREPTGYACPAGMVGVPVDGPAWCIDAYEVTVVDGVATSVAGTLPSVGVTFEAAEAICAATPALDAAGEVYAMRRMPTAAEWQDAGDGVVGDGGTIFPWGDTFDEGRCVTPRGDGTQQFDAMQVTGSMPKCATDSGIYDQIGNAWEWTDSGRVLDATTALAALGAVGFSFEETDDGMRLLAGNLAILDLQAAGVQPPDVAANADGYLEVAASQVQPSPESFFARGYLVAGEGMLAVRLARLTDAADAPWRVFVAREYDGRPQPDKRGCAWYTGSITACALNTASLVHLPDFDGTIGFRCLAPPYPVYAGR